MKKSSKRGKKRPSPGFRDVLHAWYQTKRPVFRYAGIFAGSVLFFCILTLTPVYQSFLEREVVWSAGLVHGVLSAFAGGDSVVSGGTLLRGEEAILEVKTRCSGLSFCWLLCAAIFPFPASWGLRIVGAVLGSLVLMALNTLRIMSLFLVGCYYPGWFPAVHEQFWPTFSLLVAVLLMGAWLVWVKRLEQGK